MGVKDWDACSKGGTVFPKVRILETVISTMVPLILGGIAAYSGYVRLQNLAEQNHTQLVEQARAFTQATEKLAGLDKQLGVLVAKAEGSEHLNDTKLRELARRLERIERRGGGEGREPFP